MQAKNALIVKKCCFNQLNKINQILTYLQNQVYISIFAYAYIVRCAQSANIAGYAMQANIASLANNALARILHKQESCQLCLLCQAD